MSSPTNVVMVKCYVDEEPFPGFLFIHKGEVHPPEVRDAMLRQAISRIASSYYVSKRRRYNATYSYYYEGGSAYYSTTSNSFYGSNTNHSTF